MKLLWLWINNCILINTTFKKGIKFPRKSIGAVILLFQFIPFSSQTKISGFITDYKNNPLFGVSIGVKNHYDGATSDSAGAYSLASFYQIIKY